MFQYERPASVSRCAGRPRFIIPKEQLEVLTENRFTVPQMADMLGVSVRTVRRRMSEFNCQLQVVIRK